MGSNMRYLLSFAKQYPGWHTYAKDAPTLLAVEKLKKLGKIETNEYHQFRGIIQ